VLEARPVNCTALNSYSPLSRLDIVVSTPRALTCNVMIPTSRLPTAHSVVYPNDNNYVQYSIESYRQ
jgi:hypothetical protein